MADWATDKKEVWERVCAKYGGSKEAFDWGTWGFFDWSIGKAWPTIMTISKARKFGWNRYDDTFETWVETFRTFSNAGILPRGHLMKALPSATKLPSKDVKVNGTSASLDNHGEPEAEAPSMVAA